jgi:hypothetical protein
LRFRPLPTVLLLLAAGAGTVRADAAPLVGIDPVALPDKKAGGRDLRHVLGAQPEAAAAQAVAAGLRGTSLVAVADPGTTPELVLRLTVEKARTRPLDRSDVGGRTSLVELDAAVSWQWLRDGRAVHSGRLRRQGFEECTGRIDTAVLTRAWEELLADIGREVALEAGAAEVFFRKEVVPLAPARPAGATPRGEGGGG